MPKSSSIPYLYYSSSECDVWLVWIAWSASLQSILVCTTGTASLAQPMSLALIPLPSKLAKLMGCYCIHVRALLIAVLLCCGL